MRVRWFAVYGRQPFDKRASSRRSAWLGCSELGELAGLAELVLASELGEAERAKAGARPAGKHSGIRAADTLGRDSLAGRDSAGAKSEPASPKRERCGRARRLFAFVAGGVVGWGMSR
jgi:hypothetical protein